VKIFISYSRRDASGTAKEVHDYLTEIGHHEVFMDTSDILGGDEWWKIIQDNISDCHIFIIIVTRAALQRPYIKEEIEVAKSMKKKIIPCIAKKYVNYKDLPWDLNKYQGIMFERLDDLIQELDYMIELEKTGEKIEKERLDTVSEIEDESLNKDNSQSKANRSPEQTIKKNENIPLYKGKENIDSNERKIFTFMNKKDNLLFGITIIASLMIIGGLILLLLGLTTYFDTIYFDSLTNININSSNTFTDYKVIKVFSPPGWLLIPLGIISLIVSWRLLEGKKWARTSTPIISIIAIIFAIVFLASSRDLIHIIPVIIYGIIILLYVYRQSKNIFW
jgi:hypothetical protein